MATDLENLLTIRSNLLAALADISANPKPTYSINGQSVSHNEHRRSLLEEVKSINALIVQADGPYEEIHEGIV